MYIINSRIQDIKYDMVLLDIVKLTNLKRLQEFMLCMKAFALNRSTSLPINFVDNFFIIQLLESIVALP